MESSPTLSPTVDIDPETLTGIEFAIFGIIVGVVIVCVALIIFSALIVRSARYDMPVPLIAPLSMLALVAIILGAVIGEARELIAVGSAAVGALAACLTAVFNRKPGVTDSLDQDNKEEQ